MKRSTLDEEKLTSALADGYWRVKSFSEVESTQDVIRTSTAKHGDVVAADYQIKGRGRLDRTFESPPEAGLLFSLFIEPKVPRENWGLLPLLVGMTVAQTLNSKFDAPAFHTKWPNDVLARDGKVGGILCETFDSGVIVGIGINVNTSREELPIATATSVYLETGEKLNRTELLIQLLRSLEVTFSAWNNGRNLIPDYLAINSTIGKQVQITLPDGRKFGSRATGIGSDGALELETGEKVRAGDVVHLR